MKYFPNFYPTKSKKIESCYLSWLLTWIKFVIIHINCNCCHQHSKPDLLANLHPHYIKPSNSRCHFPTHPFSWGCPFKSPLTRSPRHLILDSLIQHSDRSSAGSLFQSRSADEESTPPTWGGQDWQSPTRSDLNFKSRSHSDRLNLFPQKPGKTRLLLILATKRRNDCKCKTLTITPWDTWIRDHLELSSRAAWSRRMGITWTRSEESGWHF